MGGSVCKMFSVKRKGILIGLISFMSIFFLTLPAYAASGEFMGGSGTENDPYIISNKTHLDNVRNYPDAHFSMVTDITFSADDFAESGLFYHDGAGWQAIPLFSGTFDGGGNTIYGLTITVEDPVSGKVGLFGCNEGTICDLNLEDLDCQLNRKGGNLSATTISAGGIAAQNSGLIENCNVRGTVAASSLTGFQDGVDANGYLGGIVGVNTGTVQNCSNMATVEITSRASSESFGVVKYTGGIAGRNGGTISCCYNGGTIDFGQYSGGIAGNNVRVVENCFNIGSVRAVGKTVEETSYSGGLCGSNTGSLRTSYNVGRVTGSTGTPCVSDSAGTVRDCYYYNVALDSDAFTDGLSKEEMETEEAFEGFDFSEIWMFDEDADYPFPVLRGAAQICTPEDNSDLFGGGNGSIWAPYQISTAEHFANIAQFPAAHYQLTEDISLPMEFWVSIGFTGYFDGDGHTISNSNGKTIATSEYSSHRIGLFKTNSGYICNLTLVLNQQVSFTLGHQNSSIDIGGLVSYNGASGVIRNCEVKGYLSVSGGSSGFAYIGGIAADNDGTISNCTNSSIITVNCMRGPTGGIVGGAGDGLIQGCTNTGKITFSGDLHGASVYATAGGIAGLLTQAKVYDCVNSGAITATARTYSKPGHGYSSVNLYAKAGGIVGDWTPVNNTNLKILAEIVGCTNSGDVNATASTSGVPINMRAAFSGGICGNVAYDVKVSGLLGPYLQGTRRCEIERCGNSGDITAASSVTGDTYSGGISGVCYGSITDCWNSGSAVYAISASPTTVSFCYNVGITDEGMCDSDGSLKNSYDAGKASSDGSSLYRVNHDSAVYYLKGAPYQSYTRSYSELSMRVQSTYTGFDFKNDWIMLPGSYPYPQLRSNLATPVKSIYIAEAPSEPLECIEGYFPSYNGLKLGILFEDGTSVVADPWSECFSLLDADSMGTQTIPLTVLDYRTKDKVEITVREKSLDFIEMEPPAETRYDKNVETIDLSEATLFLIYDDGSVETMEISPEMVSGFMPGLVGTQSLTVTYGGKTCSFDITVYDVAECSVVQLPAKTEYVQGQPINPYGGVMAVTYTDGVTDEVSLSAAKFSYDETAVGTVTVTAVYREKTATFPVTMLARQAVSITLLAEPEKLSYAPFEKLDFTGSQLKVVFESTDNYTEILPLTEDMIHGYDNTMPGYQTLTVQYCGKSTSYLVHVQDFLKSSSCSESDSGGVTIFINLNVSEQTQGTVVVGAYRDGRLVGVFLEPVEAETLSFTLKGVLATDVFKLFLLDDESRPLLEQQTLVLEVSQ